MSRTSLSLAGFQLIIIGRFCVIAEDRITPRHFEAFAEAAGLAKPLVRKRVPELARTVVEKLDTLGITQPDALHVAQIIRDRSEKTIAQFVA